jgi:hypothetical protein
MNRSLLPLPSTTVFPARRCGDEHRILPGGIRIDGIDHAACGGGDHPQETDRHQGRGQGFTVVQPVGYGAGSKEAGHYFLVSPRRLGRLNTQQSIMQSGKAETAAFANGGAAYGEKTLAPGLLFKDGNTVLHLPGDIPGSGSFWIIC